MGFLAILNAYTMRISLSIAITELVVKKNHTDIDGEAAVCLADDMDHGTSVTFLRVQIFWFVKKKRSNSSIVTLDWRYLRMVRRITRFYIIFLLYRLYCHAYTGRVIGREVRWQMDSIFGHIINGLFYIDYPSGYNKWRCYGLDNRSHFNGLGGRNNLSCLKRFIGSMGAA